MSTLDPRAEQLNLCLDRIAAGESVEAVLAEVTDIDTAELVKLAVNTRQVAPTTAPPAFRARLQAELQSELDAGRPGIRSQGGLARLWLGRAVAVVLALAMVVSSAVMASANDVPGESLYGLKRAVETARLAMAFDPQARVQMRIVLVGVRLAEIEEMIDRGMTLDAGVIEELIAAQKAAEAEAESIGDAEMVELAKEQGSEHGRHLESIVDKVDAEAREIVHDAARALSGAEDDVRPAAGPDATATTPAPEPSTTTPTDAATTSEPLPTASETAGVAPPLATEVEIASPAPVEQSPPAPTSLPAASSPPDTPTHEPPPPAPTDVPATAVAVPSEEPSPLPTLKREDERNQTKTAEARPAATQTPTRRRPPQHGNTEPTPTPSAPPPSAPPPTAEPQPEGDRVPGATARPDHNSGHSVPTRRIRPRRILEPLPTSPLPKPPLSRW